MFKKLLSKLKPIIDAPEQSNVQFGFEKHAENIAQFLANDDTPRPFVIGIHGEWGSGKTTFLREIKRKLETIDKTQKIIEFSSWEYERTDVFASLLQTIVDQFGDQNHKFGNTILTFGCDILLRKMAGMSIGEAKSHFQELSKETKTIKNKLDEIINEKLILFIDDLDRCNVDNILSMLENIKWFLTVERIIIVVTVDMDKVEKAWELRYNNDTAKGIGREHTEKMFQLKLSVPHKSEKDLKTYVNKMAESLGNSNIEFLVKSLPPNPRKIKLALNLIYFVLNNTQESILISKKISENDYLQTLVTWIAVMNHHRDIAEIAKLSPSYLVYAGYACAQFEYLETFRDAIQKYIKLWNVGTIKQFEHRSWPIVNSEFMTEPLVKILEICATSDKAAFKTLKHYGRIINVDVHDASVSHVKKESIKKFEPYYDILKEIIENTSI